MYTTHLQTFSLYCLLLSRLHTVYLWTFLAESSCLLPTSDWQKKLVSFRFNDTSDSLFLFKFYTLNWGGGGISNIAVETNKIIDFIHDTFTAN